MSNVYIPDARMTMPELFYPGRKPVGNVKIDIERAGQLGLLRYYMMRVFNDLDLVYRNRAVPYDYAGSLIRKVDGIEFSGVGGGGLSGQVLSIPVIGQLPSATITFILTPNDVGTEQRFFSHSDYSTRARIYIGISGGKLYIHLGGGSAAVSAGIVFEPNVKHILTIAWSGTTATAVLDGRAFNDFYSFSDTPGSENRYTSIGAYSQGSEIDSAYAYSGIMHDVMVFGRRHTVAEILRLHNDHYRLLTAA